MNCVLAGPRADEATEPADPDVGGGECSQEEEEAGQRTWPGGQEETVDISR